MIKLALVDSINIILIIQIVQLNHIGLPARLLVNSFYSHSIGAKCVTRKNGLETTAMLEERQICRDGKSRRYQ
jgi:hypothetical protein